MKTYILPTCSIVDIENEIPLLCGSGGSDDGIGHSGDMDSNDDDIIQSAKLACFCDEQLEIWTRNVDDDVEPW